MRISDWSSDVCSSDLQLSAATHCLSENPIRARCSPRLRRRKGPRPFMLEIRRSTSRQRERDRKSTRLNSQSLMRISYAVFCLNKNKIPTHNSQCRLTLHIIHPKHRVKHNQHPVHTS